MLRVHAFFQDNNEKGGPAGYLIWILLVWNIRSQNVATMCMLCTRCTQTLKKIHAHDNKQRGLHYIFVRSIMVTLAYKISGNPNMQECCICPLVLVDPTLALATPLFLSGCDDKKIQLNNAPCRVN
jgi:hypothetical protein